MATLDVNLINPFIEATIMALETMAMLKPKRTKVYLKNNATVNGDISGIMGLTGEVDGSIVVTFAAETACKVVGSMLGVKFDSINDEVKDGIQEVVNLIAGQAKAKLSGTKFHFKISIPTCVTGKNHEITRAKGVPIIVAEFDLNGDPFAVEVAITAKG
ncbi:MAG: chemotaxis protein CheX [Planctomycetes bacterium]|nr:chemotaxis protein CheX [Planctomycetota bacterium]